MTDVTTSEEQASGKKLHLGWALVLISVAQLIVVRDGTIVNIALPYIQGDLGISDANLRWVVTGYALAFGSLLLLGGRLGDLWARQQGVFDFAEFDALSTQFDLGVRAAQVFQGAGGGPLCTAQNPQRRVQTLPRIMNVAVR